MNPSSPKVFENISSATLANYKTAAAGGLETVLMVDANARQAAEFRQIEGKLTSLGGSLFRGRLNASEVESLRGVPGVALDLNREASSIPVSPPKPQSQIPDLLWDASVTIPETDPSLVAARAAADVDGSGVLVAVLDTGVDSEALGLGGGKVVHREDFTTPPSDRSCTDNGKLDPFGHGTHVASIVAGATDSRSPSVQGVAPGAQILDLRVLNCSGSGEFSAVDQALQWILDNQATYPVKIVNMSLGASDGPRDGLDPTSILINRLVAQGIFVAVAAGNGYAPASNLFMPAASEFATTVASATVNKYGSFLAPYSSHGPTSDGRPGIDITAPGSGIRAALTSAKSSINNYETVKSGTSMATPYIAGLAALLLQKNPSALPSGTVCELSSECPSGVVKSSMTNDLEKLMKVSDWFAPGTDPDSGRGLVSASASLSGNVPPASKFVRGSLDANSNNIIQIPAHSNSTSMTLLLDTSYRTDMWDRATFNVTSVDANYSSVALKGVCTLLELTTCLFGEPGFTPRLFTYYLPPSTEAQTFVIKSSKALGYSINIDNYGSELNQSSGVRASTLKLDGADSGSITLERTLDSATSTVYEVTATGGLGAPLSVTLPAGIAGTNVSVSISATSSPSKSLDRVVFTDSMGAMVAATVRSFTTGDGPLIFPNVEGFDDSDQPSQVFMAEDGSLLGTSFATGITNSSSYANPFRVAPNSRTVVKYEIPQTVSSQIDSIGLSQDGSTGLFRQFPAGSGIVAGDESLNWTYFVRNLDSGASSEVGPDWSQWSAWNLAATPSMVLNEFGTAAAWTVAYPSGVEPVVLVSQSGPEFANKVTLDSFSANTSVSLHGFSNGNVLVRVFESGVVDELRLYAGAETFTILPQSDFQPSIATFSANGEAVGYANWNNDILRCSVGGVVTTFASPTQLGMSYPTFVRVANDCSWILVVWDRSPGWPRGQYGTQLLRIKSDGTITRLDQTVGTGIGWITNLAGNQFLRSTALQLEPGDLNGMTELYRGLGGLAEDSVRLKQLPQLSWNLASTSATFGQTLKLVAVSPDSNATITYVSQNSTCTIAGDLLTPSSGIGGCMIEARIHANEDWLERSTSIFISFTKATTPDGEVSYSAPSEVQVNSEINFSFINPNSLPYQVTTAGACAFFEGRYKALYVGTCFIHMVRSETENFLEKRITAVIQVTKLRWGPDKLAIADIPTKYPGEVFDLIFQNGTGIEAQLAASGACSISGLQVTIGAFGNTCTISASVPEGSLYASTSITKVVEVGARTSLLGAILDPDWSTEKVLPKGSKLSMNAVSTVTSGACTYSSLKITATGSSGSCTFTVGGYTNGSLNHIAKTFTIKLGPPTQSWMLSLPTYTTKKLLTSKFVFISNGQPKTNIGIVGAFSVSSGCKIGKSGKSVAIEMGKLRKCVVTLRSTAGFRVPAINKTWTFTR